MMLRPFSDRMRLIHVEHDGFRILDLCRAFLHRGSLSTPPPPHAGFPGSLVASFWRYCGPYNARAPTNVNATVDMQYNLCCCIVESWCASPARPTSERLTLLSGLSNFALTSIKVDRDRFNPIFIFLVKSDGSCFLSREGAKWLVWARHTTFHCAERKLQSLKASTHVAIFIHTMHCGQE